MNKIIVADSSPLIVLLKSDLEDILPALFERVVMPEAVWQEILAGKEDDAAKEKLVYLSWIKSASAASSDQTIESLNLGKGETEVLSLALIILEARVLLDDYAARKTAKT